MHRIARFSALAAVTFAAATQAQSVISARSGTIHYVEGKVLLNDQQISPKFGEFPGMDNGAVLRTTDEGRVEVLLSPGVILRVGESSSIRMVSNSLLDTRVELQTGKAVLECADILKGNGLTLMVGGKSVSFAKDGLYEATAEPPALQVYKGEATVLADGKPLIVKHGHEALLGSVLTAEKFDGNDTDDLYNWSSHRSGYLALANVSAAGSSYGSYGYLGGASGGWAWNPWFGMFTWVPGIGMGYSPFGFGFYSPYSVYGAYPYYATYYGNGTSTTGSTAYGGRPITSSSSSRSGGSPVSGGRLGEISSGSSSPGRSIGGGAIGGRGGH
jgi:hypothetical protein